MRCSVCDSKDAVQIVRERAQGVSLQDLASRFGLTKSSLHRHFNAHVPRGNTATKTANALPYSPKGFKGKTASRSAADGRCPTCLQSVENEDLTPESIIRRSEKLLAVAERIAVQAEANNDSRLALMAIDRAQKSLDSLAKIHGLIGPDSVTLVDARQIGPDYTKWSTEALRIVQGMIDAFEAGKSVSEALEAIESHEKAMPQALSPGHIDGDAA